MTVVARRGAVVGRSVLKCVEAWQAQNWAATRLGGTLRAHCGSLCSPALLGWSRDSFYPLGGPHGLDFGPDGLSSTQFTTLRFASTHYSTHLSPARRMPIAGCTHAEDAECLDGDYLIAPDKCRAASADDDTTIGNPIEFRRRPGGLRLAHFGPHHVRWGRQLSRSGPVVSRSLTLRLTSGPDGVRHNP